MSTPNQEKAVSSKITPPDAARQTRVLDLLVDRERLRLAFLLFPREDNKFGDGPWASEKTARGLLLELIGDERTTLTLRRKALELLEELEKGAAPSKAAPPVEAKPDELWNAVEFAKKFGHAKVSEAAAPAVAAAIMSIVAEEPAPTEAPAPEAGEAPEPASAPSQAPTGDGPTYRRALHLPSLTEALRPALAHGEPVEEVAKALHELMALAQHSNSLSLCARVDRLLAALGVPHEQHILVRAGAFGPDLW